MRGKNVMTKKRRKAQQGSSSGRQRQISGDESKRQRREDDATTTNDDKSIRVASFEETNFLTGITNIRNTDKLYAAKETIICALDCGCVPCAYKIGCFDVALDKFFCKLCPNQRPEHCPRTNQNNAKANNTRKRHIQSHSNQFENEDGIVDNTGGVLGMVNGMSILTVGDGDFSFSLGLARRLLPSTKATKPTTWIVATSYEKKETLQKVYPSFDDTLSKMLSLGVTVVFEVDATNLSKTLIGLPGENPKIFHRIIWNFPCTAISMGQDGQNKEMEENKKLVKGFVESARIILSPQEDGEIWMCHKTKPPFNQWNLEEVALKNQERSIHIQDKSCCERDLSAYQCRTNHLFFAGRIVLDRSLFSPYTPRKALDRKSFSCHDACFYVFAQHRPKIPKSMKCHGNFEKSISGRAENTKNRVATFSPTIAAEGKFGDDQATIVDQKYGGISDIPPLIRVTPNLILSIRQRCIEFAKEALTAKVFKKTKGRNRKLAN